MVDTDGYREQKFLFFLYQLTCGNVCVSNIAVKDPTTIATTEKITNGADAYDLVEKMLLLKSDTEMYRDLYNSLLNNQGGSRADMYFILKDFRSYADAQARAMEAYKDKEKWAKMALKNTACCGKFSADRTIQEYVDDIWHLDHVVIDEDELEY